MAPQIIVDQPQYQKLLLVLVTADTFLRLMATHISSAHKNSLI